METEFFFFALAVLSMAGVLLAFTAGRVWLIGSTAVLLVLANIVGPKVVSVFGFAITAGTPLFAALPLATDLLTERYGKAAAKQAVWLAFSVMFFFIAIGYLITAMNPLPFATEAGAIVDGIFAQSLRLLVASPVAYLIWQFIDIALYHAILKRTGEGHLWLRNNVSTFVAQAGSTLTFFVLAFLGTGVPWFEIALVTIGFYWVIALIDTVIVYASRAITPLDHHTTSSD